VQVQVFQLEIEPAHTLRWMRDPFNNIVAVANFGLNEAETLSFRNHMELRVDEENPFDFILEPRATVFPFKYNERELSALSPYLLGEALPGSHKALDWFYSAVKEPMGSDNTVAWLLDINQAVQRDIAYEPREEEGVQTPNETLQRGKGSCRDMAVLFIAVCRQMGLAARFASGYLYVSPDDKDPVVGAGSSMHAWAEVFLPGAGWKGFDPTNGILTNHDYLTTAVANRPEWVNPIQGKYFQKESVASQMHFSLRIDKAL